MFLGRVRCETHGLESHANAPSAAAAKARGATKANPSATTYPRRPPRARDNPIQATRISVSANVSALNPKPISALRVRMWPHPAAWPHEGAGQDRGLWPSGSPRRPAMGQKCERLHDCAKPESLNILLPACTHARRPRGERCDGGCLPPSGRRSPPGPFGVPTATATAARAATLFASARAVAHRNGRHPADDGGDGRRRRCAVHGTLPPARPCVLWGRGPRPHRRGGRRRTHRPPPRSVRLRGHPPRAEAAMGAQVRADLQLPWAAPPPWNRLVARRPGRPADRLPLARGDFEPGSIAHCSGSPQDRKGATHERLRAKGLWRRVRNDGVRGATHRAGRVRMVRSATPGRLLLTACY